VLANRAFYDRVAGEIDKRANRQIVRRFGVRQFDAVVVPGKGVRRFKVEKVLSY
jgi:hypothetical protein